MSYIGALGVNTFDDEIEEATNSLTNLIITEDILQAGYSSNYTNKHGIFGRKALEGTAGSPGDVNLGIPTIPSTGGVAVAATIATITAACIANGITVLTLLDMLEDKVDLNKTQTDKIGGWSSNYADEIGVWGSNYTDLVGKYGR